MSKKLVVYFSPGRETRFTARELAEVMNADLYEIKAETPYTIEDLDWMNPESRSCKENADPDCRPATEEKTADLSGYDMIFLGFPIWWDSFPRIIATFLENNDFSGKTIIPFATSKGGGMGTSANDIRAIIGEQADVKDGMLLNSPVGRFKIQTWLVTMGITEN